MELVLIGVEFDASGADGEQALLRLAEVSDDLGSMVGTSLLVILESADVVLATLPRLFHPAH